MPPNVCLCVPPISTSPEFWHYFNYTVAFCAQGRLWVCVRVCVSLSRQTMWCLFQDTHIVAALCPLVLPWAAHRMLACFDALSSSTYCRHTHTAEIANYSLEDPAIFLKFVIFSQTSLLKAVDFLRPEQCSDLSYEASVKEFLISWIV